MTAPTAPASINTCPRCGRAFTCGMQAGAARCWCAELPPLPAPYGEGQGCYCPDCLKALTQPPPTPA